MVRIHFLFCASLLLIAAFVGATEGNQTEAASDAETSSPDSTLKPTTTPKPITTTSRTATATEAAIPSTSTTSTTPTEPPPPKTEKVEDHRAMMHAEMGAVDEEAKEPPNQWGTYYSLPAEFPDMSDKFDQVFLNYLASDNPETECLEDDVEFNRWYKSSENLDHALFSYYCKTKQVRGYEHLKVSLSKLNVLEFHGSLKGFQITDAGDYETKLSDDAADEIRRQLLPLLVDQIALQTEDSADQDEICPDPGTETYASVYEKYENGLYYDKIAVSCNKTVTESGISSHMTEIEVVTDRDFKALNDGSPVLVSMGTNTIRNTMYIEEQERLKAEEALKQVDGVPAFLPGFTCVMSFVVMSVLQGLF